ncbi:MAG: hypothetical protein ACXW4Z_13340, partial [Candidatus Binatia bacterium]
MKLKLLALTGIIIASALPALAHSPKPGNRAIIADAGNYHVEVMANGTSLSILLWDQTDKAVSSEGHNGTAIFVIDGKAQRIPLAPAG